MLWIEPCTVLYASLLGASFGAASLAFAYRQTQRYNMKLLEQYWQTDIKYLRSLISEQDRKISELKLSPNSVSKPVHNQGYFNKNKGKP